MFEKNSKYVLIVLFKLSFMFTYGPFTFTVNPYYILLEFSY